MSASWREATRRSRRTARGAAASPLCGAVAGARGARLSTPRPTTATPISAGTTPSGAHDPPAAARHRARIGYRALDAACCGTGASGGRAVHRPRRPTRRRYPRVARPATERQKGLDAGALDAPSPYQMPEHPIGHGAPYGGAPGSARRWPSSRPGMRTPIGVLGATRQRIIARGIDAPPVRCWPHHFDLDSLISLGSGRAARTVGRRLLARATSITTSPISTSAAIRRPMSPRCRPLPPVGHWHTHHFTAAVAHRRSHRRGGEPRAATEAFLRAATDILIGRPDRSTLIVRDADGAIAHIRYCSLIAAPSSLLSLMNSSMNSCSPSLKISSIRLFSRRARMERALRWAAPWRP